MPTLQMRKPGSDTNLSKVTQKVKELESKPKAADSKAYLLLPYKAIKAVKNVKG